MKSSALVAVALGTLLATSAVAQNSTGTSGSVSGQNVSAGTYGSGVATPTGTGISGGGDATATNGTAETNSTARANERTAMQRSVASAESGDERARSRTMTRVLPNDQVKSRTMSVYKERGEKPVIERSSSSTSAPGGI